MPDDDVLLCLDLSVRLSVCLPVSVSPHSFPIGIRIRSCFTHSVPSASLPLRAVFTSLCWPAKRILCHFLLIASYIESSAEWELKGGKEMLFTFSMALFTSYFRASACAFAMHTDTHVFLFGFSVSCVRSSFSYAWVFHKTKWHSGTTWHHSGLSICIFECAFSASSSSALILPTVARVSEIVNTRVKQMYKCKIISALSVWFCFQHFSSCFFLCFVAFFLLWVR